MFKKIALMVVLLTILFSPTYSANAGLFDWLSGRNTTWTFGNVYEGISQTSVVESQNPVTPVRTRAAPETRPPGTGPSPGPVREYVVTATAYSSTVDQTDDTPFITASGTYVRDGIAAANFLPFGTVFKIPDIYGDKIFVVEDRMNKRYWHRVDIWFPEREMALEFGVKQIRIEIIS